MALFFLFNDAKVGPYFDSPRQNIFLFKKNRKNHVFFLSVPWQPQEPFLCLHPGPAPRAEDNYCVFWLQRMSDEEFAGPFFLL